jgi:ribose-phosphate pyrophosphokinase
MSSETIELTELPGLESPEPRSELQPGHFIERGTQRRLMLFAGRSHPELAHKIGEHLGVDCGEVTLKTFANGEGYCRFEESIRGADVFLLQTGSAPVDTHLMEICFMAQAAKLGSAKRITAVMPLYPYARQDRKARPREPISARLVADFLQTAGVDRVLTMDLHAGQIQGFFNIPVDHMIALPLFASHFRTQGFTGDNVVSVSPDPGRARMAVHFGKMLDAPFAIIHKTRPEHDTAEVTEVTGRVRGKIAIMGDDRIDTGGTLIAGARALREHGAEAVYVFATHGIFAGDALEKLGEAPEVDAIAVTDTVPIDPLRKPDKITVVSVSSLLADTIWNVFSDESVSAIFAGENQLF